jgi:hypothetical protein
VPSSVGLSLGAGSFSKSETFTPVISTDLTVHRSEYLVCADAPLMSNKSNKAKATVFLFTELSLQQRLCFVRAHITGKRAMRAHQKSCRA